jgi:hypothetical protein
VAIRAALIHDRLTESPATDSTRVVPMNGRLSSERPLSERIGRGVARQPMGGLYLTGVLSSAAAIGDSEIMSKKKDRLPGHKSYAK